jgi:hypothetical protein
MWEPVRFSDWMPSESLGGSHSAIRTFNLVFMTIFTSWFSRRTGLKTDANFQSVGVNRPTLVYSSVVHVSVNSHIYIWRAKSRVTVNDVNNLQLHIQTFYNVNIVGVCIIFLTLTRGQCKYLSNTFTWPHANVVGARKCIY